MFCMGLHEELERLRTMNIFQRNAFLISNWPKQADWNANPCLLVLAQAPLLHSRMHPLTSQRQLRISVTISKCLQMRGQEVWKDRPEKLVGTYISGSPPLLKGSV